ncbi:RAMP superfamily CRISPR-associated protein [Sphaerothrix gracilis]|uniref:RAMP superfamily CRISPR-associated protein n=1 Tax=Sphaerothrix gracilis TaxID=3151835 RepID=UPI0031FD2D9D
MVFAQAFREAEAKKGKKTDVPAPSQQIETHPEQVPMMYRAQVQGRCSLQYANDNKDLERWTEEWVNPRTQTGQPLYQHEERPVGLDGTIYRFKLKFPWRVFTDCGQDSILRPVIGKDGMPFIPGSSLKGIFRRLLYSQITTEQEQEEVELYCGSQEKTALLRFHGAYPIGDWAGTEVVTSDQRSESQPKIRYRMVDVVHPQQPRQVQGKGSAKAIALISFHEPTLLFELSSTQPLVLETWQHIEGLFKRALRQGLGGKTSTGYGLWVIPKNQYAFNLYLHGVGVSSLLRNGEPEFRPNLFKATLRGHASRLLAGVCKDPSIVKGKVDELFGSTKNPGKVELYWELKALNLATQGREKTPISQVNGVLHLDAPAQDLEFIKGLAAFAYAMGGFGKSWRRVWHKGPDAWHTGFLPTYTTRAIGCQWSGDVLDTPAGDIHDGQSLQSFLQNLHSQCKSYLGINDAKAINWREAWHPRRLAVFTKETSESEAISLFHNDVFKTTPAVGGRTPDPKDAKLRFSSVWHRMLPLTKENYLEIVTIFFGSYSEHNPWLRDEEDQLPFFIEALESSGFKKQWGSLPNSS